MEASKRYGKNYVQLVCTRQIKGETNYLIYKRNIEPFLGCSGFPSGKVEWGEKIIEAASRELREETGLVGKPKVKLIIHYIFNKDTAEVVDDQYMYVCHIDEPQGDLTSSGEGENKWIPESMLPGELKKPFVPIENYLRIIEVIKEDLPEIKFFELNSKTRDY